MKRKVVIYIRFNDNDAGLNLRFRVDSLSPKWIRERFDIFYRYTRKNIELQSCQDFLTVLRCHPDSMNTIRSVLKEYPALNKNIIFSDTPKEVIKSYIKGADEFYLAHIDSDDLYHPDFVKTLYQQHPKPGTAALICQRGYIYNVKSRQLCFFKNVSSAVFIQLFPVSEYMDTYQYYPEMIHVKMYQFPYEPFPKNMFMILTHNMNISTRVNPYLENEITDQEEKDKILKAFQLK